MSSELLLDYGPLGYPVPPEYATSFFPGFKGQSRADHLPVGCHVVYPGLSSYKQEPSSHARSLLPYTKCSPYYPLFSAMIDAQSSAFRPHKPSVKSSFDPPTNSNHAATTLYYNNRRVCTCNLAFTTPRTPPKHPICTPPKHPICTPEYYSWIFPSNGPYPNDDIPIGLRLSSLTTRPYPIISRRHEENEKRPAPKRFQCPHCEKSFGKSSHLRDHVRTHTGDRPYRCEYCDKAFTQYSNLRTHTRIHTGERPYRCSHCSKSFTQAVTLRSHTRTHLGEKAYHCKQCSKSFACFSGLKGHIRVHETSQASTHSQEDISPDVKVTLNIKQEVMDDVLTENQN